MVNSKCKTILGKCMNYVRRGAVLRCQVIRHKVPLLPNIILVAEQTLEHYNFLGWVSQLAVDKHVDAVGQSQMLLQTLPAAEKGFRLTQHASKRAPIHPRTLLARVLAKPLRLLLSSLGSLCVGSRLRLFPVVSAVFFLDNLLVFCQLQPCRLALAADLRRGRCFIGT